MDVLGYINRMILGEKLIAHIHWAPTMAVSVRSAGHISHCLIFTTQWERCWHCPYLIDKETKEQKKLCNSIQVAQLGSIKAGSEPRQAGSKASTFNC